MPYQCGRTNLHFKFLVSATWHLSVSVVSVTMCVTSLETALECNPPIARTPPMIASLSPLGRSEQHTTTPEKKSLGSGLCCRGFASFLFESETSTQSGLTTGISLLDTASYSSKSIEFEITCVTSFKESLSCSTAPFSSRILQI